MTPVLLLEINEVPWRLLDKYLQGGTYPHLEAFFSRAAQYTTLAVDTGELSPWVTWPTVHRGMNNDAHQIRNLGQDPASFKGTAIWDDIRLLGGSIGVCGSMQSWPPREPGPGGFYIPDTFAHDAACIPSTVSALQAFNLAQIRRNARVTDSALPRMGEALHLLKDLLQAGVRVKTLARLAVQVASERVSSNRVNRRSVYQALLFWDVFRGLFHAASPPAFSTFFTNHLAGVMHRYWADIFPEDFPERRGGNADNEVLMAFAFKVLDEMMADVLNWCEVNPDLVVVFASSMGQGPIHRDSHEGIELVVENLPALMQSVDVGEDQYRPLLAMVPQVAVEIDDDQLRALTKDRLLAARTESGAAFIRVQEIGKSLSITVQTPKIMEMKNRCIRIMEKTIAFSEAGIRYQEVEPGTGYHIPQGSLAVLCARRPAESQDRLRGTVPADRLKPWLISITGEGHGKITNIRKLVLH